MTAIKTHTDTELEEVSSLEMDSDPYEESSVSIHGEELIGSVLVDGRYEIESIIGEGGYGVVYRAKQLTTGQFVAIKLLRADKLGADDDNTSEIARFEREMKLIGQLNHPNIVRLIDFGRLDDQNLFTVLEYIDGVNLSELIQEEGALRPSEAKYLMSMVLEALGAAHELGIVYRDLKPHNVMITTSGVRRGVKLLDFGISGLVEDARDSDYENLTQEGVINGTPAYMAPEQLHGWSLTPQSDIYAWGLVFLETLTGRKAVQGASYVDVLAKQISSDAVPIPTEISDQPLGQIIARAVAKDLDDRYETARDVLYDLEDCVVPQTMVLPWTGQTGLEHVQESISMRQKRGRTPSGGSSTWSNPVNTTDIKAARNTTAEILAGSSGSFSITDVTTGNTSRSLQLPKELIDAADGEPVDEDFPEQKSGSKAVPIAIVAALMIGAVAFFATRGNGEKKAPEDPAKQPGAGALAAATTTTGGTEEKKTEPPKVEDKKVEPVAEVKPKITLALNVTPSSANIMLDGKQVGTGTYSGTLEKDGKEHTITVKADGFKPFTKTFNDSVDLSSITLEKEAEEKSETKKSSRKRYRWRPRRTRRSRPAPKPESKPEPKPEPKPEVKPKPKKPKKPKNVWGDVKSNDLANPWGKK